MSDTAEPKRRGPKPKHPPGTTGTTRARLSRVGKTHLYLAEDVMLLVDARRLPGENRTSAVERLLRQAAGG